jgi:HEAT repeat protein
MRTFCFLLATLITLATVVAPTAGQGKELKDPEAEYHGRTLAQWVKDLDARDKSVVQKAVQVLMQVGEPAREDAVCDKLILIIGTPKQDTGLKLNAVIALGTIGLTERHTKRGVDALLAVLNDTQAIARFQAAMALGRIGPKAEIALDKLAKDSIHDLQSWEIRRAAAFALGRIGAITKMVGAKPVAVPDSRAINALAKALHDPCADVRLAVVSSLGILAPASSPTERDTVQQGLTKLLADPDKSVVIGARLVLVRLLNNNDPKVDAHVAVLAQFLKDKDLQIQCNAAQALGSLREQAKAKIFIAEKQKDEIAKMLDSKETEMRARGAHVLGLFGEEAVKYKPRLLALLKDDQQPPKVLMVTCAALGEMGKLNGDGVVDALTALVAVRSQDERLVKAAKAAIERIKERQKEKEKKK